MSGLTDFLLARIAEDEERGEFVRRQIEGSPYSALEPWLLSWHDEYDLLCIEPARALAECEAKRRIVADYLTFRKAGQDRAEGTPLSEALTMAGIVTGYERAVSVLALPYADHPDYRDEWRP